VTPRQFAAHLNVNAGTVKRWCFEGMPCTHLPTGEVVIDLATALPWAQRHSRLSTNDRVSFVYFAARSDGALKIGWSNDPERRRSEVGADAIVSVIEGADKRTEIALHELFAPARVDGEWFRPVPELLSLVESLGGR
jgi:hypothetical protein